ncbi:uncharacterized protein KIAA1257 homolog [Xenopus tropicalis]|uniref:Uncharacterized protein KIAA1257 homolog n=1 Tax=Xenopus tropicalis TaxID=8364 RepID=A0A8J1JH70_XENTR|nr:uncharacterized protein KIAA1257 homolog [Xenopus tropicalis]
MAPPPPLIACHFDLAPPPPLIACHFVLAPPPPLIAVTLITTPPNAVEREQIATPLHSQSHGSPPLILAAPPLSPPVPIATSQAPRCLRGESAEEETRKGKGKSAKNVIEAPKAQGYYHFEYFLLPGDTEPMRADVVSFGAVAKLYLEHESRILKPWHDSDRTWLIWTHSVELSVTKNLLLALLTHEVQVQVWSSKEKVAPKARFDRPKAFRVPQGRQGEDPKVKDLILRQIKIYEEGRPRASFVANGREGTSSSQGGGARESLCDVEMERSPDPPAMPHSASAPEKGNINPSLESLPVSLRGTRKVGTSHSDAQELDAALQRLKLSATTDTVTQRGKRKAQEERSEKTPSASLLRGEGKCLGLTLSFLPLVAGDLRAANRFQETSERILDCYVSLALDAPLLSDQQKRDFNPLVIRIHSATSLPVTPTPISALKDQCLPVFCRYRFCNQPPHRTQGREHGTHVYFEDVNVILAGSLSPAELREFLQGPPLEIEVHDRDKRAVGGSGSPSLFGAEPEDEKLSNVGLVTSKPTNHNPYREGEELRHPYGVARVDMSELLHGAKYLNLCAPIHNCAAPDPIGQSGKSPGILGAVDGPPAGRYLDAQSLLKVRVDIAVPLALQPGGSDCPFGLIVYIFHYKDGRFLEKLLLQIGQINAKALNLGGSPDGPTQEALSLLALRDDQRDDPSLDVITGFHLMDGEMHLFVLEGLREKGVRELWETLPTRAAELEILYNSQLAFRQRRYRDLGVLLCHIQLHAPLSAIVRQPLLYVRDMVPTPCFHALSRLDFLRGAKTLRRALQRDLLPSADMIELLSREFGVPVTPTHSFPKEETSVTQNPVIPDGAAQRGGRKLALGPLDNCNTQYTELKRDRERQGRDFIQSNIEKVNRLSRLMRRHSGDWIRISPCAGTAVHNYSSQTLSSSRLAHRALLQALAKEPRQRFTYSQEFHSATVSLSDPDADRKVLAAQSKGKWMSPGGFVYPGFKSSIESNEHPKKPDEARIAELSKAWREGTLHRNTQQPTLPRERWCWEQRHQDFQLPPKVSDTDGQLPPPSAPPTGETPQEEERRGRRAEYQQEGPRANTQSMRFHRCLAATELAAGGPQASSAQGRLEGLLKDKPAKLSLRRAGLALKPVPALSVLQNSGPNPNYIGQEGGQLRASHFVPGELGRHRLTWEGNAIPCPNTERGKFQQLKGQDFNLNCSQHSFLYKGEIKDLSPEERGVLLALAQTRAQGGTEPGTKRRVQASGNIIQTQSHNGFLLQVQ